MPGTFRAYVRLTRPFTLLPPVLGVLSGAVTAWGSASNPRILAGETRQWTWGIASMVLLGAVSAALLNAASNAINQYYDFENDRINKPTRPLITGEIAKSSGFRAAVVLYAMAVLPTWLIVAWPESPMASLFSGGLPRHQAFGLFVLGMLFTWIYSAPAFGRTKANAFGANLTIAIPRGCLLKVAGWSTVASVLHLEPWFIGSIFGLFLVGAASTKDFSDMAGDAAAGCRTLPIRFGVVTAARMIAPFFVLPWLLIPIGAWLHAPHAPAHAILTGNRSVLTGLGCGLALWGCYTVSLILRNPEDLAKVENHPSWTHMYLMLMAAQIGFAVAYLV
jgi:4-hydroxybenzoate polyprenyltransferase